MIQSLILCALVFSKSNPMCFIVFDGLIKIFEGISALNPNNRDTSLLEVDMPKGCLGDSF